MSHDNNDDVLEEIRGQLAGLRADLGSLRTHLLGMNGNPGVLQVLTSRADRQDGILFRLVLWCAVSAGAGAGAVKYLLP